MSLQMRLVLSANNAAARVSVQAEKHCLLEGATASADDAVQLAR